MPKLRVGRTLTVAATHLVGRAPSYLGAVLALQLGLALVVLPLVRFLFRRVLGRLGLPSLTQLDLARLLTDPVSLLLAVLVLVLLATGVVLELAVVTALAARHRAGRPDGPAELAADLVALTRRLWTPQTLLLVPYVLVLIPLTGAGTLTLLLRDLRLPDFISGELLKSTPGTVLYGALLAGVLVLAVRTLPTIACLLGGDLPSEALAHAWRVTRGRFWRLTAVAVTVVLVGAVGLAGISSLGVLPTRYVETRHPGLATAVAGLSLALVEVAAFVVVGLLAALLSHVALALLEAEGEQPEASSVTVRFAAPPTRRQRAVGLVGLVVLLGVLAVRDAALLRGLEDEPRTELVAHRGYTAGGVENTIESLEAAAVLHPAYVELDVMQTADEGLVVMHDNSLRRLAGTSGTVAGSTLAELTATTVRAGGLSGTIPAFDDYLQRAGELGVDLLVELKPHGGETASYVPDVVAALQAHGMAEDALVQALDPGLLDQVHALDPTIETGLVVPLNVGDLPRTDADFVTLEDFSYTRRLAEQARAEHVRIFVWTVNDPRAMRGYFRDGADAIITNRLSVARRELAAVTEDTSTSSRLEDVLASRLLG